MIIILEWRKSNRLIIGVIETMALYPNDFTLAFSNLLKKSGVTCYKISQYTHLDQGYLSRLQNGGQNNPSPETIVKIGLALCHFSDKITIHDIEKLLYSTGRSLRISD